MFRLIVSLAMLALAGCGPMYSSSYQFVAPKSKVARQCIASCVQERQNCQAACTQRVRICNFTSRRAMIRGDRAFRPRVRNCNFVCSCDARYRACYTSCGGEVLEQKTCTAFCG